MPHAVQEAEKGSTKGLPIFFKQEYMPGSIKLKQLYRRSRHANVSEHGLEPSYFQLRSSLLYNYPFS